MAFDIKQEIDKFNLKEWVSFEGRIPRQTWWLRYFCVALAISVVINIIAAIDPTGILGIVLGLASIVLVWPYLAGGAKRMHDRGMSAWWLAIAFIPIVGGLALLVMLGFLKGTTGPNKYGPDPLGGSPIIGGQDQPTVMTPRR